MIEHDPVAAAVRRWARWAEIEVDDEAIDELVGYVRRAYDPAEASDPHPCGDAPGA